MSIENHSFPGQLMIRTFLKRAQGRVRTSTANSSFWIVTVTNEGLSGAKTRTTSFENQRPQWLLSQHLNKSF